jgi:hypothetical protein
MACMWLVGSWGQFETVESFIERIVTQESKSRDKTLQRQ